MYMYAFVTSSRRGTRDPNPSPGPDPDPDPDPNPIQLAEMRETVDILEVKIQKLEQLVRLKDSKIATLQARVQVPRAGCRVGAGCRHTDCHAAGDGAGTGCRCHLTSMHPLTASPFPPFTPRTSYTALTTSHTALTTSYTALSHSPSPLATRSRNPKSASRLRQQVT